MPKNYPKTGVGVIIAKDGKVLVGKRLGNYAPYYSIPGGKFEIGETFEECAIREIKEETNLDIINPKVIAVTNNMITYKNEGKHYISIVLLAEEFTGELKTCEPDKCEGWIWVDPHDLPQPHYDASERGIDCYLSGECYKKYE